MGRRFGGLKQLTPLGPGGATLMDYTVHDALRAGVTRVAWVTRPELEPELRAHLAPRWGSRVATRFVFQCLDDLPPGFFKPPGRERPWGTGHAVLAAAAALDGPFVMANADDFYGRSAILAAVAFVRRPPPPGPPAAAVVGYPLRDTLSQRGAVSRAVCEASAAGVLARIVERTGLHPHGPDATYESETGVPCRLPGDTPVSMNLWAVPAGLAEPLRAAFARFLAAHPGDLAAEFYWPAAVNELLAAGRLTVGVLPGGTGWCGLTHASDLAEVAAHLRRLTADGQYSEPLW